MGIPGFDAVATLVESHRYYVASYTGFFLCGAEGQPCCRAPFQNFPAFSPLVRCNQGLGCDITTDECVANCGGPGQVCCDGPETRALKWTADGEVYSPTRPNMREMCDAGACDKQTHRCSPCGTQDGSPCCPPDAAQYSARCVDDNLYCEFDLPNSVKSGTCRACGGKGKPPCSWGCDTGLGVLNKLCDFCGDESQPPCDDLGCHQGLGLVQGKCGKCGESQQVPCDNNGCALGIRCSALGCVIGLRVLNGVCAPPPPPPPTVPRTHSGGGGSMGNTGPGTTPQMPPPPESCSPVGGPCVPDNQQGIHCCQHAGAPELCFWGGTDNGNVCHACIPHGEEVPPFGTQVCCSVKDGDMPVLDQSTGKTVCGIPG
jgi:hypothetical protein